MALSQTHEYFPDRQLFHGFVPRVMGTKLEALLLGSGEAAALTLWEDLCAEAERLDGLLDRFNPCSEVSRLNAAADAGEVFPEPGVLSLIRLCEAYRERTGGLFDITRGTCGEGLTLLRDGGLALHGGNLDFGGFAKGYFLRVCLQILQRGGIGTAYLDFGGSSILALGHHPFGQSWRIRVESPYSGALLQEVDLVDGSLSTSGNRPRYSGHILHPRTGEPLLGPRIVTVVSPDPLDAEVLSTAAALATEEELASLRNNFELAQINRFDLHNEC